MLTKELPRPVEFGCQGGPAAITKSVLSEYILQPGLTSLPHKKPIFLSNNPIISTQKSYILSSYNKPVQCIRQYLLTAWLVMGTQQA